MKLYWEAQVNQQQLWHDWRNLSDADRDLLTKDLLLGLNEETAELQRLLDHDRYHILKGKGDPERYEQSVAEAGVDVFKYLVALMALHKVPHDLFERTFWLKSRTVAQRWFWESENLSGYQVLLCDIDDCIAKWMEGYVTWCKAEHGIAVTDENCNFPEMEIVKNKFYASGGFLSLSPVEGAIAILNNWRAGGEDRRLVMVTARPYRQHPRVYADTITWCDEQGLKYDHLLFEIDKAEAVRKLSPTKPLAFIEDRPKHALSIASTGTLVLLYPEHSEEKLVEHPMVKVIEGGWSEIGQILEQLTPKTREAK